MDNIKEQMLNALQSVFWYEGPNVDKIKNMIKWSEHKRKMPAKVDD